eukprot:2689423-Prymnesium_polylepis.1
MSPETAVSRCWGAHLKTFAYQDGQSCLKSVISSCFLSVSRRMHLKSVSADASQDEGDSKWTRPSRVGRLGAAQARVGYI